MKILKVCGMRDGENIKAAESLGIDWMGFIFWHNSPRYVSKAPSYTPDKCKKIGVFVNPSVEEIINADKIVKLDGIQLHGYESPEFCNKTKSLFDKKGRDIIIIKTLGIEKQTLPEYKSYENVCDYFLFDTKTSIPGGSGIRFEWSLLNKYEGCRPFVISGGINEESYYELKRFKHQMWTGIDLNSRFETSPGIKDICKLKEFILRLKESDVYERT